MKSAANYDRPIYSRIMTEPPHDSRPPGATKRDYDRTLGVVECFTVITEQCPSGAVRRVAEAALEAVKGGGRGVLREQAHYVLMAIRGWRGERSAQVHRSLSEFIGATKDDPGESG